MGGKLGGFGGPPRYVGILGVMGGGGLKWGVVWELCGSIDGFTGGFNPPDTSSNHPEKVLTPWKKF